MATIPNKVADRLAAGLKRFQPIISSARSRDVNESDTVTIVIDMLAELFGYDKYSEVTKEFAIKSTFCDLGIKIDGQCQFLIEAKAVGIELKEQHSKQAVDYAANQGVEWVALTNGHIWKVFRVIFAKPIGQELVAEIDLSTLNPKNQKHLEQMYLLSREGWVKSSLSAYYTQRQATNKFFLGAMLQTEPMLDAIRRELKKYAPDVKVVNEEIKAALVNDVLKREIVEGEKAIEARDKIEKTIKAALRQKSKMNSPAAPALPSETTAPVEATKLDKAIEQTAVTDEVE